MVTARFSTDISAKQLFVSDLFSLFDILVAGDVVYFPICLEINIQYRSYLAVFTKVENGSTGFFVVDEFVERLLVQREFLLRNIESIFLVGT